ncbi:ABC transporter ATP-binding protein [Lacisediminimonas profundi]|uniref:ABC transporter ATP-binding protein n=1 Tax=Lacisediminimonas profundi TaxID=2603856 RepID=UPI001F4F9F5A|nr:ABC transporter ATP-binding protein [Lacisediminimonas profundi]
MNMPSAAPMLSVQGLGMQFGGLAALSGVTLDVAHGEFVGIIGPNGAGKTTFFHAISGIIVPTSGLVRMDGREMQGKPPEAFCRAGVARTFQTPRIFAGMTVQENIRFAFTFGNQVGRSSLIDEVIEETHIGGLRGEIAGSLPPARQRQLEIAMALVTAPRLLLLDEVAAGLTESEVEDVARLISRLRKQYGLTVVWIEHAVRTLMRTVDRVAVLHFGRLLADGTPAQVSEDESVISAYLGEEVAQ